MLLLFPPVKRLHSCAERPPRQTCWDRPPRENYRTKTRASRASNPMLQNRSPTIVRSMASKSPAARDCVRNPVQIHRLHGYPPAGRLIHSLSDTSSKTPVGSMIPKTRQTPERRPHFQLLPPPVPGLL